jgi:PPP family 3-phenylpropionic acid transporter
LKSGLLVRADLWWLVAVVALHSVFWNAILAQYEVITLASLGEQVHRYGQVRLWGSVSFIAAVVGGGQLFDRVSITWLPQLLLALLVLIAAGTLVIREPAVARREPAAAGLRELLGARAVQAFLAASFLLQFSHAPYYGFFSLYLEQHGYNRAATGLIWSLGVIAEIGVFAFAHRLLARFGLRAILLASLLLAALRWLMIGFGVDSLALLLVAQCLHAASFGSFHAAGIEFLRRHFGAAQQGQGQAVYAAVSFGAGGALGALVSGLLWDLSARLGFVVAALAALAGWWIVRAAVRGPLVEAPGAERGTMREDAR